MIGKLRQQGGAIVLTVPTAIITKMGWQAGNSLHINMQGDAVVLTPTKRQARGRKTLSELLDGIDPVEIHALNKEVEAITNSAAVGKEEW